MLKLAGPKRKPKGIWRDRIVGTRKGSELSHLKARGRTDNAFCEKEKSTGMASSQLNRNS